MSSFAIFSYRIDANRMAPFVSTQIERRRSDFRPRFFGAVVFKFEPNLTVLIKYLFAPKSGLLFKKLSTTALIKSAVVCICVDTVHNLV